MSISSLVTSLLFLFFSQGTAKVIKNHNSLSQNQTVTQTNKLVPIIHCTGGLRRPKALDCDNDGIKEKCDCGFGICNFHCNVLGWDVFKVTKGLPIDKEKPDEDQVVVIKSIDGKYLLYKFIQLTGDDRVKNEEPFVIDEEYTYSCDEMQGTVVIPQTATTFYPSSFESGSKFFDEISGEEKYYFGVTKEELYLDNSVAWAIIKL